MTTTTKLAKDLVRGDVFRHQWHPHAWLELLLVDTRDVLVVATVCVFGCDRNATAKLVLHPDETVEVAP